jgi:hypothetical protein
MQSCAPRPVADPRTDPGLFLAALLVIPLWLLAEDPLWAIMLPTLIELLGFGPTLRKAWWAPYSESVAFLGVLGRATF